MHAGLNVFGFNQYAAEMGTGGMMGGTPIVNFELTPHNKNFKWFTVGGTPIKISNWNNEIKKIAEKFAKIL